MIDEERFAYFLNRVNCSPLKAKVTMTNLRGNRLAKSNEGRLAND